MERIGEQDVGHKDHVQSDLCFKKHSTNILSLHINAVQSDFYQPTGIFSRISSDFLTNRFVCFKSLLDHSATFDIVEYILFLCLK